MKRSAIHIAGELSAFVKSRLRLSTVHHSVSSFITIQISKTVISGRQLKRIGTGNQPIPGFT